MFLYSLFHVLGFHNTLIDLVIVYCDTLHLSRILLDNTEQLTKQTYRPHFIQQKTDKACEDSRLCRNGEYIYTESRMDIDTLHMYGFTKQ